MKLADIFAVLMILNLILSLSQFASGKTIDAIYAMTWTIFSAVMIIVCRMEKVKGE